MTAYNIERSVDGRTVAPANRALLRQLDCREDIRRIFEKIGDYAAARGFECHIDLNDPPKLYVHARKHALPSLKVTIDRAGHFVAMLTEAFVEPKCRTGMDDMPLSECDQRYEVIELAVRYVKALATMQPRPADKARFRGLRRRAADAQPGGAGSGDENAGDAASPRALAGDMTLGLGVLLGGLATVGALLVLMERVA